MYEPGNTPRSLTLSIRLYEALLVIYPSDFRRDYAAPMLQVFQDSCLRALRENGASGLAPLWGRTMLDAMQTAIEEHTHRGIEMSKDKFFKLSGWALLLGSLALILGFLASTRPEYNRFNARSLPVDQYINAAVLPLIVTGMLLLVVGFTGLFLRYGQNGSSLGRYSLGLGALGSLTSAISWMGMGISDDEFWWMLFMWSMAAEFLGLTLFGIANLRHPQLPRWNALPIFTGIWFPLFVLAGTISEQVTGRWVELPEALPWAVFLVGLAGLAGMGYLLQSDSQPAEAAAAAI